MAITLNTSFYIVQMPTYGNDWWVSAYSADTTGNEELKAAESGKCHYVKRLWIYTGSDANQTVSITSGATVLIGPIPMNDYGGAACFDFGPDKALQIPTGGALTIDAGAAGYVSVIVDGRTA
jgi:hypothetical protein